MARLFTAITLDQHVREQIAAEQRRLVAAVGGASVRWVQPEHLHLTLVFIGEVPNESVGRIVEGMQQPFPLDPFTMEFAGLGVFPPRGAPRALWFGIGRGVDDAQALHRAVAERLQALGLPPEERAFTPHLTLGRWRGRARPSERPRDLGLTRIASADVRSVTLFSSRPSSTGPSHTVLAEAALTGAPLH
jgi:2'-5' RNA ligase